MRNFFHTPPVLRKQEGDTIVEVLICIAIVGVILVGAFVLTNRSQLGVRDSQEHAEASKLLEGQLEQLRSSAIASTDAFTINGTFCMVNAVPTSSSSAKCKVDSGGAQTTGQPQYRLSIARDVNGSGANNAGKVFTISVLWDNVQGSSAGSKEEMVYRLYP